MKCISGNNSDPELQEQPTVRRRLCDQLHLFRGGRAQMCAGVGRDMWRLLAAVSREEHGR